MNARSENRMREHFEEMGSGAETAFSRCRETTEQTIQSNPMLATMALFGLGLGLGTMIGSLIAASAERRTPRGRMQRWYEAAGRALPESVQQKLHF